MSVAEVAVPDVAGEIIGWRAWQVAADYTAVGEPGVVLVSVTRTVCWHPREWLQAHCDNLPIGRHRAPAESCMCGIYAVSTRERLLLSGYNVGRDPRAVVALGEVALAGKVIPGTRGWRAEKARPVRLFVPHEHWRLAARLEELYEIPVELANTYRLEAA